MKSIARTVAVVIGLLTPAFVLAQGYTQQTTTFFSNGLTGVSGYGTCIGGNIMCAASTVLYIINGVLVPVLFAVAFIVFLYGIAKAYIFSHGDPEEVSKGHRLLLWGLIAFAVMISVWGLVNVVANTFGLNGAYAPLQPYSPYQISGGSVTP
ncbi:MAG: hypothetical protein PHD04_02730 [Candidatus Pacebacteria bacterium]|nr:hypothetical protein [Candidatus Paceibacterota bacterium]